VNIGGELKVSKWGEFTVGNKLLDKAGKLV
jgi:hypothetical protein